MKSDRYLSFQEKEQIIQWSILSIPVEPETSDHLLTFFASIITDSSLPVKLPPCHVKCVINILIGNKNNTCMEVALRILGSLSDSTLTELKLHCLLLVRKRSIYN